MTVMSHPSLTHPQRCASADDFGFDAKPSMCYGIEYFLAVYPMPGWNAAFERAKRHLAAG